MFVGLEILLFLTAFLDTVTLKVAFFFDPSFAVAVIVTVPAFFPLTVPAALTVATFVLLLAQATLLLEALLGVTVAFNVIDLPT